MFIYLFLLLDNFMATSMRNPEKSPSALTRMKEKSQKIQSNAKEAVRRMPIVLTEQQLTRLKEHKYASEGTTLFDPLMQEFWKWLVQYCPLWVAPNLLTIVGLAVNIGTSVLLMIETNGAKEEVGEDEWFFLLEEKMFSSSSVLDGCIFSRHLVCLFINLWMQSMVNKLVERILSHLSVNYLIMVVILSPLV